MRTVWDFTQEQAEINPAGPAAVGQRQTYTYQEIVERAQVLAKEVRGRAPEGALLAVDVEGPVSGAVCLLAAAQAGCAVLPLNTESPAAHRARVLENARPALLIRAVDECDFVVAPVATESDLPPTVLPDIAYVMYTSGSTGQPKGVMVPHDALAARTLALAQVPGLAAGESMLAMTALSFDISLAEMLVPLVVGAKFVAARTEARTDPEVFAALAEESAPDVIQATPSFWRLALAGGWAGALRSRIWCGGEPLTPPLAEQLIARSAELWNLYGPTEATIWASAAHIDAPKHISLGNPLPGGRLCLDTWAESGQDTGEILLYGDGLALGYLGEAELTNRRFHSFDTPEGRHRVYRTGDRGRLGRDGQLEFLGRNDSQIKLRGHRIELGEVESVLEDHPDVSEAVAVVRHADRPERAYLVACLVTPNGIEERELRGWLRERLPASHCPAKFTFLDALPRTTAGKVDRVQLAQANA